MKANKGITGREEMLRILEEIAQEFQAMNDEAFKAMLDKHAEGELSLAIEYAITEDVDAFLNRTAPGIPAVQFAAAAPDEDVSSTIYCATTGDPSSIRVTISAREGRQRQDVSREANNTYWYGLNTKEWSWAA